MSEEEAIPYKRARQFGEELQLLRSGNEFFNWGGLQRSGYVLLLANGTTSLQMVDCTAGKEP